MSRFSWFVAMIAGFMIAGGCAKRVGVSEMTFEEQQRVVVSFRGGEQVEGRIGPGRHVELREPGVVWKALVDGVTEDRIVLKDLVQIQDPDRVGLEAARSADARLGLGERVPERTLLRSEITGVEHVKTDVGRTARHVSFWTGAAVVLTLLMGERS